MGRALALAAAVTAAVVATAALFAAPCVALDNGVALTPPLGWSTWNTFGYGVSDVLLREMADAMVSSGLAAAGYEYVLIDDGWPACDAFNSDGGCSVQAPRDAAGRIAVDRSKFPNGMKAVADYVHSKGLKIGIYTAVSNSTCGGFSSSLGHEHVDAQTFADWGMDFVKHDTCNSDCGIRDGCILQSTARMRDGLNATGRPIVYYIDDGNDSSGSRVFNPKQRWITDPSLLPKIADRPSQLVWTWGAEHANMWKLWFDHHDHWYSTMDNIQHMIGLEMYQSCGGYNTPDMLTVGQGALTAAQYRVQMFVWSVLGAPLILGADLRTIDADSVALVTAPEVLAVDQDSDCVAGSLARIQPGGGQLWIRPLSDSTFAAVLFNSHPTAPLNMSIVLDTAANYGDLYPAVLPGANGQGGGRVSIRDLYARKELGLFEGEFVTTVPPQDAVILKLTPKP